MTTQRQPDFEGWATVYGVECSDGLTLHAGAFNDSDGCRVPVVWQHQHNSPNNVLGHAELSDRGSGIWARGFLSTTREAQNAKTLINDGSIRSLSIFANRLQKVGNTVMHGVIRELSLVIAGANSEATIQYPQLAHGLIVDEDDADEFLVHTNNMDGTALDDDPDEEDDYMASSDYLRHEDDMTVGALLESGMAKLTDGEREAFETILGIAAGDDDEDDEDLEHNDDGGGYMGVVSHNVWDDVYPSDNGPVQLSHADQTMILQDAIACGSLKDAFLAHDITGIDILFPEAHNFDRTPRTVDLPKEWVKTVMSGVGKAPWFNLETRYADTSAEEMRALGYITDNRKKEQVFPILKRKTSAQTVYSKGSLSRDKILEIVDFDVVAWMQQKLRTKLEEELARAYLIGDGRSLDDEDKINEDHIIPIAKDDDLFTIKASVPITAADSLDTQRRAIITSALLARTRYRGSGNPTLFIDPITLAHLLLIEDRNGRRIYESEASLATAMRVSKIVEVPILENQFVNGRLLAGIIVNLGDYTVGSAKGGEVTNFSDFDIDFNKYKYLIETRCSGMLVETYSAIDLLYPEGVNPLWYVEGGTNTITTDMQNALLGGGTPTIKYFKAKPVEKDNPYQNGWFERSGAGTDESPYTYTATTDMVVDSTKTYYVRSVSYLPK